MRGVAPSILTVAVVVAQDLRLEPRQALHLADGLRVRRAGPRAAHEP